MESLKRIVIVAAEIATLLLILALFFLEVPTP